MNILKIRKFYTLFIIKVFLNKTLGTPFFNFTKMYYEEEIELSKHFSRKYKVKKRIKKEKLEKLKKIIEDDDEIEDGD